MVVDSLPPPVKSATQLGSSDVGCGAR